MVGRELVDDLVTERHQIGLDRDVDDPGEAADVGGLVGDDRRGLGHRVGREVTERDVGAGDRQLTHELAAHAGAAAGDDGDLACEVADHAQLLLTGRCL